jgi:hypothetical protein
MVTDACADDAAWESEQAGTCAAIAKMSTTYETGSTAEGDGFVLTSREKACAARGTNGKYGYESCPVWIKILRRVRAESPRRPPRHRRDACSMAWRCRFLAARPSQDSRTRHTG